MAMQPRRIETFPVIQKVLLALLVAGWIVSGGVGVASASDPRGQTNLFELGVYAGAIFPSSSHELYDYPSVSHKPFNDFTADVGIRLGYLPLCWVGFELEGGAMPASIQGADEPATLYTVRGHLLFQIPWTISPFLVGGGGMMGVASSAQAVGNDIDPAGHWGGGIKWYVTPGFAIRVDGRHIMSNGRGRDAVAHHVEALAGLSWVLGWTEAPAPLPDTDGDGVPDDRDRCPLEPANTADGCPPPADQDGDGVPDELDRCPTEPAHTSDGCPPDRDGDGVPDELDECPDRPGTAEYKGCPPDRDGDGIPDAEDKCPDEPETRNGYQDDDGCPDELPKQVQRFTGTIRGINFSTGSAEVRSSSFALLNKAVKVLQEYPDLRLLIRGHTDTSGSRELNARLSAERAEAVKAYFVTHGVAEERLSTEGLGPDEPVASNATAKGRAENRRIEFKIVSN